MFAYTTAYDETVIDVKSYISFYIPVEKLVFQAIFFISLEKYELEMLWHGDSAPCKWIHI